MSNGHVPIVVSSRVLDSIDRIECAVHDIPNRYSSICIEMWIVVSGRNTCERYDVNNQTYCPLEVYKQCRPY